MDLSAKTPADLRNMLENAERVLARGPAKQQAAAAAQRDAVTAELAGRKPAPGARGPSTRLPTLVEAEQFLIRTAAEVSERFDLSREAALATGAKPPHALLGKDGKPKLGGRARTGQLKHEPYLSWRGGKQVAELLFAVPKDGEAEPFWWGGLSEVGKPNEGAPMERDAAAAAFLAALERIASPRN